MSPVISILITIILGTGATDDQKRGVLAVCDTCPQNDTANEIKFEDAVLRLTGAGEMEELEESVVEMYEELRRSPLRINCCGRSRLLSCGLFSRYQVATLMDYRQRCGDVLSLTELATVDGFGTETVRSLSPFVDLEGSAGRHKSGVRQNITAKASGRLDGNDAAACGGVKYHAEFGERVEVNWCDRNTYSDPQIGWGTLNAAYYGRRWLGKVIAGDYNARFGQGLLMWTGFSLSGVSSSQSLWRNGTGLSPSRSFTARCRGVAADFNFGSWSSSAAFDIGAGIPRGIVNINKSGRTWQAGVTGLVETGRFGVSSDWRIGFNGGAVFGELAVERRELENASVATSVACVAGAFWIPSYGTTLSAAVRAYPNSFSGTTSGALRASSKTSDEYGASLAFQNRWATATADALVHPSKDSRQIKLLTCLKPEFDAGGLKLRPSVRGTWRCSASADGTLSQRYDLRAEFGATVGRLTASARFNTVHSKDWSWLGYVEAGWSGKVVIWLRGSVFRVDNWDDRIYAYERDAPGSFNVPAYYGRGWNASAVAGLKAGVRHSFWLRTSAVAYPWMADKDGRLELKLQYSLSLNPPLRKTSRE